MGGDGSGIDADAVLVQLLALVRRQNIRREDVDAAVALLLPACSQTQDEIAWTGVRSVLMKALDQSSDQRVHVNLLYTVFGLTKLENGPRERPEWVSILREVAPLCLAHPVPRTTQPKLEKILEHFEKFHVISNEEQKAWRSKIKVERKTFEARGVDLTYKDCANMCRYALEVIDSVFEALAISRGVLQPGAPHAGSLTPPPHLATTPNSTTSTTTPVGRGNVVTPTQTASLGSSSVQTPQGQAVGAGKLLGPLGAGDSDAQRYWDKASMVDLLRHSKNEVKLASCWLIHRVMRECDGVLYLEADIRCIPLAAVFLAGKSESCFLRTDRILKAAEQLGHVSFIPQCKLTTEATASQYDNSLYRNNVDATTKKPLFYIRHEDIINAEEVILKRLSFNVHGSPRPDNYLEQWGCGNDVAISDFDIIRVAHDHLMQEDNLVHAETINSSPLAVALSLVLIALQEKALPHRCDADSAFSSSFITVVREQELAIKDYLRHISRYGIKVEGAQSYLKYFVSEKRLMCRPSPGNEPKIEIPVTAVVTQFPRKKSDEETIRSMKNLFSPISTVVKVSPCKSGWFASFESESQLKFALGLSEQKWEGDKVVLRRMAESDRITKSVEFDPSRDPRRARADSYSLSPANSAPQRIGGTESTALRSDFGGRYDKDRSDSSSGYVENSGNKYSNDNSRSSSRSERDTRDVHDGRRASESSDRRDMDQRDRSDRNISSSISSRGYSSTASRISSDQSRLKEPDRGPPDDFHRGGSSSSSSRSRNERVQSGSERDRSTSFGSSSYDRQGDRFARDRDSVGRNYDYDYDYRGDYRDGRPSHGHRHGDSKSDHYRGDPHYQYGPAGEDHRRIGYGDSRSDFRGDPRGDGRGGATRDFRRGDRIEYDDYGGRGGNYPLDRYDSRPPRYRDNSPIRDNDRGGPAWRPPPPYVVRPEPPPPLGPRHPRYQQRSAQGNPDDVEEGEVEPAAVVEAPKVAQIANSTSVEDAKLASDATVVPTETVSNACNKPSDQVHSNKIASPEPMKRDVPPAAALPAVDDSDASTIGPDDDIDERPAVITSNKNVVETVSQFVSLAPGATVVPEKETTAAVTSTPIVVNTSTKAKREGGSTGIFRSALLQITRKPPSPIVLSSALAVQSTVAKPAAPVIVTTLPPSASTPDKLEIRKRRFGGAAAAATTSAQEAAGPKEEEPSTSDQGNNKRTRGGGFNRNNNARSSTGGARRNKK